MERDLVDFQMLGSLEWLPERALDTRKLLCLEDCALPYPSYRKWPWFLFLVKGAWKGSARGGPVRKRAYNHSPWESWEGWGTSVYRKCQAVESLLSQVAPCPLVPGEKRVRDEEWRWRREQTGPQKWTVSDIRASGISGNLCIYQSSVCSEPGSGWNARWALMVGVCLESTSPRVCPALSFCGNEWEELTHTSTVGWRGKFNCVVYLLNATLICKDIFLSTCRLSGTFTCELN